MEHCTKGFMSEKFRDYNDSNYYSLYQCYARPSHEKVMAFNTIAAYMLHKYDARHFRILSHNDYQFTMGCIGEIDGCKAFFYITKDKTRYIFVN